MIIPPPPPPPRILTPCHRPTLKTDDGREIEIREWTEIFHADDFTEIRIVGKIRPVKKPL